MTKQMISFTDPQRKYLERESKRLGITKAELVRRALDSWIQWERNERRRKQHDRFSDE